MESGGHGRGERVTAMDHQGYQESHCTRGNDEALGNKKDRCRCAALLACTLLPFEFPLLRGGTNRCIYNLLNWRTHISKWMASLSILCIKYLIPLTLHILYCFLHGVVTPHPLSDY